MDLLDEYLQGPYLEDKREEGRVDSILREVWPGLADVRRDNRWPYELIDGTILKTPNWSFSTCSMILFGIGAALGLLKENALLPSVKIQTRNPPDERLLQLFWTAFDALVAELLRNADEDKIKCSSNSFGENDPFTISWLLLLLQVEIDDARKKQYEGLRTKLDVSAKKLFERLKETRKSFDWKTAEGEPRRSETDHMFPILRAVQVFRVLKKSNDSLTLKGSFDEGIKERFTSRVHQHLSYYATPNGPFDAAELVFSLEGILLLEDQPVSLEKELIIRIFEVLDQAQKRSPYWRPLKPFVTTSTGSAHLPLSVEMANSLLRICRLLETGNVTDYYFSKYYDLFKRYTEWLFTRVTRIKLTQKVEGQSDQEISVTGWHSEHVHESRKIHPWETAQVGIYLMYYRAFLQEHIARTALSKANLTIRKPKRDHSTYNWSSSKYWKEVWEKRAEPLADLASDSRCKPLAMIRKYYVDPRVDEGKRNPPHFSMLLFGPPGTGKTAIAEELSNALQWPLITISPSNFIAKGEAEVEARTKNIFDALCEQNNAVILFDEIDQLILDRDSRLYREQGDIFKFMTPGMLVKLKTLREMERPIFIIATNYEERIDKAVKRLGRIDDKFLVLPPGKSKRGEILRNQLIRAFKKRIISEEITLSNLEETVAGVGLEDVSLKTVFATYGELKQLAETIADSASENAVLKNLDETMLRNAIDIAMRAWEQPVIRLSSYRTRFCQENDGCRELTENSMSSQAPLLEYLLLLYLKCEAGMKIGDDEAMTPSREFQDTVRSHLRWRETEPSQVAGSGSADLIQAIQTIVSDEQVAETLALEANIQKYFV